MTEAPEPEEITGIPGTRFHEVRWFESLDSTNRYLLDEARRGAPEGVVVVADHQTAGRGRRGRTWVAPPGASLLVSVLLRPGLARGRTQFVTMAAGVALAEAIEVVAGFSPILKWPNDLLVGERKLAGVLAEADLSTTGEVEAIVVGVGLNVDWPDFPAELAHVATACNREASRSVSRQELLEAFLRALHRECGRLHAVPHAYRSRLGTLGRRVRVERSDGPVTGVAVDLGHTGELLVEVDAGCIVEVHAGDVVHLRDA